MGDLTGDFMGDVIGFGGDTGLGMALLGGDSEGKRKMSGLSVVGRGWCKVEVRRFVGATGRLCRDCRSMRETLGFVGFIVFGLVLCVGDGGSGFTLTSVVAGFNIISSTGV